MRLSLLITICFIQTLGFSVSNNDSLWIIWNNHLKEDTIRLKALNTIGVHLMKSYPDSALKIIENELSFAKEINHKKSIGNAFLNYGAFYRQRGMYLEAISFFEKSRKEYSVIKYNEGLYACNMHFAVINAILENYEKAISFAKQNIKLYKNLKDNYKLIQCYQILGGCFYKNNDSKENHKPQLLDSAMKYFNKCLSIASKENLPFQIADAHGNLFLVYYELNDIENAELHSKLSLKLFKKLNIKKRISSNHANLAKIYYKNQQIEEAKLHIDSSLFIAKKYNFLEEEKSAYQILSQLNYSLGNYKLSQEMYKLFIEKRDEINAIENRKSIIEQEYKYDYEKKSLADKAELREEKIIRYSSVAITILFGLLIIFLIKSQRNFKKQKKEEFEKLMSQVELLKAGTIIKKAGTHTLEKFEINKDLVNAQSHHKLNETDWKILEIICNHPTTSNKEIAKDVFLSVEGVKSSFKKMYELFEITASPRNKKLALAIKVMKVS